MGDFSGPISGCFRVLVIIFLVVVGVVIYLVDRGDKIKTEKAEKEKQEMYAKGKADAVKTINRQLDSIKNKNK